MDRVTFKLDVATLGASIKESRRRYAQYAASPFAITLNLIGWIAAGCLIGVGLGGSTGASVALIAGGIAVLVVCLQLSAVAVLRRWIRLMIDRPDSALQYELSITDAGLRFRSGEADSLVRWPAVSGARVVNQHVVVDLPMSQNLAIPCAAIGTPAVCDAFVADIRAWIERAQAGASSPLPDQISIAPIAPVANLSPPESHGASAWEQSTGADRPLSAGTDRPAASGTDRPTSSGTDRPLSSGVWWSLAANVVAGVRMLCLLPVERHRVRAGPINLIVLVLALVGMKLMADLAAVRFDGQFEPYGLWSMAVLLGSIVLATWLVGASAGASQRGMQLVGVSLAGAMLLMMVEEAVLFAFESRIDRYAGRLWSGRGALMALSGAWLFVAMALLMLRWMRRTIESSQGADRRPLAVLVALFFGLAVRAYGPIGSDLVTPHWDRVRAGLQTNAEALTTIRAPMRESVLYNEDRLLNDALATLLPQRPGTIDLYWLGVAGWGHQDVFLNETRLAQSLFDLQFHSRGRGITLVNNASTAGTLPFASVTAIERALAHIGSKMDPREDVLFLFVTSHGSAERGVSLRMLPYEFDDLSPERLKSMLDAAGIGWRVIVVSACHSGVFVPALADERTLIVTASASDRKSFGCSNDAKLTYFGRALLEESIPKHSSFVAAFEDAREAVSAREVREKLEASNPQLHAGTAVIEHLKRFEAQLSNSAAR